jgi:hypothetical protein
MPKRNNEPVVDDILRGESLENVYIARVLRKLGSGRFEVFTTQHVQATLRRKQRIPIQVNDIVIVYDTGLSSSYIILEVVSSPRHIEQLRKLRRFHEFIFQSAEDNDIFLMEEDLTEKDIDNI